MSLYHIDECRFPLPDNGNWLDCSLNIFRSINDASSLIVSRGIIPPERTFEEELDHQWSLLLGQIELLYSKPRRPRTLTQSPGYAALETDCCFRRGKHIQHQRQLAIHLPEREQMLIFTQTALQPFSDDQDSYWQKLCQSLSLTHS
ncbi:DUF1795 domain-containing protein (plasmid) [Enterobacteriaceae bacterium Kacie_13]|nr:DUF1795 domain-containing protein [Enterobacteriaceae bacterium Kacie_13]